MNVPRVPAKHASFGSSLSAHFMLDSPLKVGDYVQHLEDGRFGVVSEPLQFPDSKLNSAFEMLAATMRDVWVLWEGNHVQFAVRRAKLRKLSLLEVMAREARDE